MELKQNSKLIVPVSLAVWFIFFIVWGTANYISNATENSARFTAIEKIEQQHEANISVLQEKTQAQEIQYTEIKTQLVAIQATLADIRYSLRNQK